MSLLKRLDAAVVRRPKVLARCLVASLQLAPRFQVGLCQPLEVISVLTVERLTRPLVAPIAPLNPLRVGLHALRDLQIVILDRRHDGLMRALPSLLGSGLGLEESEKR